MPGAGLTKRAGLSTPAEQVTQVVVPNPNSAREAGLAKGGSKPPADLQSKGRGLACAAPWELSHPYRLMPEAGLTKTTGPRKALIHSRVI